MNETIDRVLSDYPADRNPYLTALHDGSLQFDDFVATQMQFYFAVVFFSRPMAVLAAKMPSARLRTAILRNVWEEHGEGDPAQRHGATFLELLDRLAGRRQEDVERCALWPEVRAFNTALIGCCALDDWEIGAGCLGIIERMFVGISASIGRGIVARGWLPAERVVHYALHEVLDVRHSDDFFAALDEAWSGEVATRYRIEQGLRLGAYVFDRLYRDLFASRARRAEIDDPRPQRHVYAE
ncbi:MAG: iron-containing redox enzyme family protein [Planctomycetes bacterium]|nr:iron-containing redox enzyme family protein [Planctomycetota bacterium]MCB9868792.1 iron-containing redox enzyme family protein [Planctomycetota bacterium]